MPNYIEAFTRKSQAEIWAKRYAARWGVTTDVRVRMSAGKPIYCVCRADEPGDPVYYGGFCRGVFEAEHP